MKMCTRLNQITPLRFAAAALLCAGVLVSAAAAQDIKITDYNVPVTRGHRLFLNGSFQHHDGPYLYEDPAYSRTTNVDFYGKVESFYNSLPNAWSVALDTRWSGSKYDDAGMRFFEQSYLSASFHQYPVETGLLFAGGSVNAIWAHGFDRPHVNLGFSLGLGRYVDATALAKAVRVNQFLIDEDILPGHLRKETLLDLATVIDRQDEYASRYGDTYPVWWYADMDRTISTAAALPNGSVGPVGLLRVQEVVERERVQRRAYGCNIEAGIDVPVSNEMSSKTGDPRPSLHGSFAWPVGLKHQFSGDLRASSPVKAAFGKTFQVNASITYAFEMSNRIDLVVMNQQTSHRQEFFYQTSYSRQTTHTNLTTVSLVYYLENRVSLESRGRYSYWDARTESRQPSQTRRHKSWRGTWELSFSVTYHVL